MISPNERDKITGGKEDFNLNAYARDRLLRRRITDPTVTTKLNSIALNLKLVAEMLDEIVTKYARPGEKEHQVMRDLRAQLERVRAAQETSLQLSEVQ
jgi:hypothetical protein